MHMKRQLMQTCKPQKYKAPRPTKPHTNKYTASTNYSVQRQPQMHCDKQPPFNKLKQYTADINLLAEHLQHLHCHQKTFQFNNSNDYNTANNIPVFMKASNKLPTLFFVQKQQSTSFNLFISTKQQKNLPSIIVLHLRQQDTAAINLSVQQHGKCAKAIKLFVK